MGISKFSAIWFVKTTKSDGKNALKSFSKLRLRLSNAKNQNNRAHLKKTEKKHKILKFLELTNYFN
jgi:hypothetical protein